MSPPDNCEPVSQEDENVATAVPEMDPPWSIETLANRAKLDPSLLNAPDAIAFASGLSKGDFAYLRLQLGKVPAAWVTLISERRTERERVEAERVEAEIEARREAAEKSRGPDPLTPLVALIDGTDPGSEFAAAETLVGLYGSRIRFCVGLGWLAWDGKRWASDGGEARATEMGKYTLRRMLKQAICAEDKNLIGSCKKLQAAKGLSAILKLSSTDPRVRIKVDELDGDPYLFNCANGTLDLRSGELRGHDPHDLITRMSPVDYDANAPLDDWMSFMATATKQDRELVDYMQRCSGYSLTGETTQEKLFFGSGLPGGGKGTFTNALRSVMGDYATSSSFDTWAHRSQVSAQRPDLACLAGARLVTCSEVDADKRLDEGVISNATGGDPIKACHKYKDPFEFTPRFKLWLFANKRPRVNDLEDETGIWRRLICLPFDHIVTKAERDPDIKAKFSDPKRGAPAVLRWAVEGARLYLRERRLIEPKRVEEATENYRSENNPVHEFMSSTLVLDEDSWITSAKLRQLYETWAKEGGIKDRDLLTEKDLAKRLQAEPYNCRRGKRSGIGGVRTRVWYGIREPNSAEAAEGSDEVSTAPPRNPFASYGAKPPVFDPATGQWRSL